MTNSAGTVANQYWYNAWGELLASSSEAISNLFRWIGELGYYFVQENESYYVRARHYDPGIGRWLSQDPLFVLAVAESAYSLATPTVFVDPSGEVPHIAAGALVGCAAGGGYNLVLSVFTRESPCQCICRGFTGCGIVGNSCNTLCGKPGNQKLICAVISALTTALGGCALGAGGAKPSEIFIGEIVGQLVGADVNGLCEFFSSMNPPQRRRRRRQRR